MNKEMVIDKMEELLALEEVQEKIKNATTNADIVKILNEFDLDITEKEFVEYILPIAEEYKDVELKPEELDNVAGGVAHFLLGIGGVIVMAWMLGGFRRGMRCK